MMRPALVVRCFVAPVFACAIVCGGGLAAQTAKPAPPAARPASQAARPAAPAKADVLKIARKLMESIRYCAVITVDGSGQPQARAIDCFAPDDKLVVWFATVPASRKVAEIRKNPRVTLYYFDPKDIGQGYVTLVGHARIVDDAAEKQKRWKKGFEAFWPDQSASYLLVEVTPDRVEVLSPANGIMNDPVTWKPTIVEMGAAAPKR